MINEATFQDLSSSIKINDYVGQIHSKYTDLGTDNIVELVNLGEEKLRNSTN